MQITLLLVVKINISAYSIFCPSYRRTDETVVEVHFLMKKCGLQFV